MTLEETLNELLVKLFKDILEIEAKSLITEEFKDITYNDMHIIEAVGVDEPRNMKTVAKLMSVTTGTLTKAMDALCVKGYVFRTKTGEISVHVTQLTVLSKSLRPLPVVKTDAEGNVFDAFDDPELRYRQRYVDLIVNNGVKDTFLKRATFLP